MSWLRSMQERQQLNVMFSDLADYWNPQKIADQIVTRLKTRFLDVVLIEDMNDFNAMKLDFAAVLDVGADFITHGSGDTEMRYDLHTIFLDKFAHRIGAADGTGGTRIKWYERCGLFPGFDCVRQFSHVQTTTALAATLADWESSLGKIVQ